MTVLKTTVRTNIIIQISSSSATVSKPVLNATSTISPSLSSSVSPTCTSFDLAVPREDECLLVESGNLLLCNSCPTTPSNLKRCPFLCSIPFSGGSIDACSLTNIEGGSNISHLAETVCRRCLPPCSLPANITTLVSLLPSSTVNKPLFPIFNMTSFLGPTITASSVFEVPSSRSSNVSLFMNHNESSPTISSASTSSSCAIVPPVVDYGDPCQTDFSDNLICSACPTLFEVNIILCSFLCEVPIKLGLTALSCSQGDLAGLSHVSDLLPNITHCQKCRTDCPAPQFTFKQPTVTSNTVATATMTGTVSPTCTSVSPLATSKPFVLGGVDTLYRESCGITAFEVDECRFLCNGVQPQFLSRCAQEDESGTLFDNVVQICDKCLPPCTKD